MNKCPNCKYCKYVDYENVVYCDNADSELYQQELQPNDSCEEFEESPKK